MATTFEVLAEPNRRMILDLLRARERPVGDLVDVMGMSQPAVSKHLRVLRQAGLVEFRIDAQRRLYRVRPEPLGEVERWLAPYREQWATRLTALQEHLGTMDDTTTDNTKTEGATTDGVRPAGWPRRVEVTAMGTNPWSADDLGRLEDFEGQVRVTFIRRFPQPRATVWRALTEPAHLAGWFPTTVEGEQVAGARLRFAFPADEAPPFDGEMLVYEPPSLMELRWGNEILRFEVDVDGSGSVLRFSATFDELGKVARDGAGWHTCLDQLGHELAGQAAPWSSVDRWKQVHPAYVDRFGPEASRIGPPEEWERVHGSGDAGGAE